MHLAYSGWTPSHTHEVHLTYLGWYTLRSYARPGAAGCFASKRALTATGIVCMSCSTVLRADTREGLVYLSSYFLVYLIPAGSARLPERFHTALCSNIGLLGTDCQSAYDRLSREFKWLGSHRAGPQCRGEARYARPILRITICHAQQWQWRRSHPGTVATLAIYARPLRSPAPGSGEAER